MDLVEKYLNEHNIYFIKEMRFSDCKDQKTLPFDYYLPTCNVCIEVDGQFHYSNSSIYRNHPGAFEKILSHDSIKNQYCIDHQIKLIRLPYFEVDNFTEILNNELYDNTEITQLIA